MTILYAVICFFFGTAIASFCHLVAQRVPRHETLMGKSQCPQCHSPLSLGDVFPVFGYLFLRGRCRMCHRPIPISHLIVEMMGGVLFSAAFWLHGWTWDLAIAWILVAVMLTESISDVESRTVIDRVWMIGLVPLLVIRIADGSVLWHLLSSFLLFGFLFLVAVIGQAAFKKEALGGGDVKLFLFIGFCLRWPQGVFALMIASFLGAIAGFVWKARGKEQIPLVPFLFFGTAVAWIFGDQVIAWYLGFLGA